MDFDGAFFDTSDFIMTKQKLGEGKFGKVYVVVKESDDTKYACKIININGVFSGHDQMLLMRESLILHKLNHPCIVKFYGINFHSFLYPSRLEPTLLTEYLQNGSLKKILDNEKESIADSNWNPTKKYICLLGIVDAMRYLHEHGILHRDLKLDNILVDDNYYPRVCDFGLSRCFSESMQISMTGNIGTPLYMAPEMIEGDTHYGPSIDVYAFAIIAYEVITRKVPFSDKNGRPASFQTLIKNVLNGIRAVFTEGVPDKMIKLISKCWSQDPQERPSFNEIYELLANDFTYFDETVDEEEIQNFIADLEESRKNQAKNEMNSNNKQLQEELDKIKIEYEKSQNQIKLKDEEIKSKEEEINNLNLQINHWKKKYKKYKSKNKSITSSSSVSSLSQQQTEQDNSNQPVTLEQKLKTILDKLLGLHNHFEVKSAGLTEEEIVWLCKTVKAILLDQPILLELRPPLNICGDIHGQFHDLLRVFEKGGVPPSSNYLFLGNYVDEGDHSIETISLLFCYKIFYPANFFLLRGNHECSYINHQYGFYDDCLHFYSQALWRTFCEVFDCLPIASIIDDKIFCIHSVISPLLVSLNDIKNLQRPMEIPEVGLLHDLLNAKPDNSIKEFGFDKNKNVLFGEDAVNKFLDKFDFDLICRGHEVIMNGYEFPFFPNQILVTFSSAPNYKHYDNKGAVLKIDENLMSNFIIIEPIKLIS